MAAVTHVEGEGRFHGVELVYLGLHEAGTVATNGGHCLGLPV